MSEQLVADRGSLGGRRFVVIPGGKLDAGQSAFRRGTGRLQLGVSTYAAICWIVGGAAVFGLVMVTSATAVPGGGSMWSGGLRQAAWVALGGCAYLVGSRLDYRRLRRLIRPAYLASLAALVAARLPHLGVYSYGSVRWLKIGPLHVQPSELAKLTVALFMADLITRRWFQLANWRRVLLPSLLSLGLVSALVLAQPDLGTAVIICAMVLCMLFVAGVPLRQLGLGGAVVVAGGLVAAFGSSYRRARLLAFLHPWAHPLGSGYQVVESLSGLAQGGLFGVGLGASPLKWGLLPNASTDFIFAVIGNELGLLGALAVVGLFVTFAVWGVRAARMAPDRFGALLAAGIVSWICMEALVNMGAALGLLPVTGIPLPFISAGGSSTVVEMAGAGLLASVARLGEAARPSQRRGSASAGMRLGSSA